MTSNLFVVLEKNGYAAFGRVEVPGQLTQKFLTIGVVVNLTHQNYYFMTIDPVNTPIVIVGMRGEPYFMGEKIDIDMLNRVLKNSCQ